MSRISWGSEGIRKYQTGVDRGVFYPNVGPGLAWSGITAIKEDSETTARSLYYDGKQVAGGRNKESFSAVLQAYFCPVEFEEYDGTSEKLTAQTRKPFGFSYRTLVGNDLEGIDHGYQIHILYNVLAMPTQATRPTLKSSDQTAQPLSWGLSTSPIAIPGALPAAHLIIDSTIAYPWAVEEIENVLYGDENNEARLPTPQELIDIVERNSILLIVDHGDGTWSAIGPDDVVSMVNATTFQISWPTAVYLDEDTYRVSSL